jgi:hypothetical protein
MSIIQENIVEKTVTGHLLSMPQPAIIPFYAYEDSGGPFSVVDHRNFRYRGVLYGIDNLLKTAGNFIVIGNFATLTTNLGGNVLDNDNTVTQISGKSGKTFPQCTFTHKTCHFVFSRPALKSSDHSVESGKNAVIRHNSVPFEPQTICRHLSAVITPKTKQLGKGYSVGYCSIISPFCNAVITSLTLIFCWYARRWNRPLSGYLRYSGLNIKSRCFTRPIQIRPLWRR